jgi:hypothetical protein
LEELMKGDLYRRKETEEQHGGPSQQDSSPYSDVVRNQAAYTVHPSPEGTTFRTSAYLDDTSSIGATRESNPFSGGYEQHPSYPGTSAEGTQAWMPPVQDSSMPDVFGGESYLPSSLPDTHGTYGGTFFDDSTSSIGGISGQGEYRSSVYNDVSFGGHGSTASSSDYHTFLDQNKQKDYHRTFDVPFARQGSTASSSDFYAFLQRAREADQGRESLSTRVDEERRYSQMFDEDRYSQVVSERMSPSLKSMSIIPESGETYSPWDLTMPSNSTEVGSVWRPSNLYGPTETANDWLTSGPAEAASERRISVASRFRAFEGWQIGDPPAIDHLQAQPIETGDTYTSRIDRQLESPGARKLANILDFLHTKKEEDASALIYSTNDIGRNEVSVNLIPARSRERARLQEHFNEPFQDSYIMTRTERNTLDTAILGRHSAIARADADWTAGW